MSLRSEGRGLNPQTARRAASLEKLARPILFIALAAVSSPISQTTLAPVFGAIPSAVNHQEALVFAPILAFTLRYFFKLSQPGRVAEWTAIWAFWIPVIQVYLFQLSEVLGPALGPGVIGFLSCHTIIIPTVYAAAEALEDPDLRLPLGPYFTAFVPAAMTVYNLIGIERWFRASLPSLMAKLAVLGIVQMQLMLAVVYATFAQSKFLVLALPALLHTALLNPHIHSPITPSLLNSTLATHNWTLLDRQWSNTGYISVLQNLDMQFRVMRCDHSLLGGEWQVTEARRLNGWKVNEPIYAVFEMLEAVRLMEVNPPIVDADAHALVVGLGIGTAPKAFISHGINTTIVELDPIVREYAMEYFGLQSNHTAIIADAVEWATVAVRDPTLNFDYILHDVFTGGAEPLALFTETFLRNLRSLLKPNGVIALNYAGDVNVPLTTQVLNTIDKVFNGQCKIYREAPPEPEMGADNAITKADFTNMVVFCRNKPGPITFRPPATADFLESQSRQQYLLLDPAFEIQFPLQGSKNRSQALQDQVLKAGDERLWTRQQAESAIQHWHIMRKVVPAAVWELW